MKNNKIVILVVVALVLSFAAIFLPRPATVSPVPEVTPETATLGAVTGVVHNSPEIFTKGIAQGPGDFLSASESLVIRPGQNQNSWRNRTGRTVWVPAELVEFGYNTGTASSSLLFYVATSSTATLSSDYTHPGGEIFPIDSATVATSTAGPRAFVGTTSTSGKMLPIADGVYLVFQVQERFACKVVGACETATSTNRGITNFFARFTYRYQP